MSWVVTFLCAVLGAAIGGVGMFGISSLCVRWYRISSFEGNSGYFMLFLIAFGIVGGFLAGAVSARVGFGYVGEAWYVQLGSSVVGTAAVLGLVLAISYLRADFEPDVDPRGLAVVWEVRLPVVDDADAFAVKTPPAEWPDKELRLQMVNVRRGKVGSAQDAKFDRSAFRQEDGQWILTARVPLFTAKGEFCVNLTMGGRDDGFWPRLSPKPTEHEFAWSYWWRTNKGLNAAADARATMYRYRIEKLAAPEAACEAENHGGS